VDESFRNIDYAIFQYLDFDNHKVKEKSYQHQLFYEQKKHEWVSGY